MSGPPLVASVVICTYNRPHMLAATLRSCLRDATLRGLGFEVIIADNSIEGHAPAIVAAIGEAAAAVRVVPASPPNISIARNAGLRAARADLVAFLDDDLQVVPGWLDALVDTMAQTGADVVVGPVRPDFGGPPPAWDPLGARFTRAPDLPSGTNLPASGKQRVRGLALSTASSIWRAATCFTDADPFDPAFGPCGGEDFELFLRLERRGRRFAWCAEAAVWETVPPNRVAFSYHVLRAYSGAQVYAAATICNADRKLLTTARLALIGLAQAGAWGLLWLPLVLLGRKAPARRALFGLVEGWGKLTWWRRVALYHVERHTPPPHDV